MVDVHDRRTLSYPETAALDEYRFYTKNICDDSLYLGNMPHVRKLLEARGTTFLMRHVQQLCWTLSRVLPRASRCRRNLSFGTVSNSASNYRESSVWIDVTSTYRSNDRGGIARVAREMARAAWTTGLAKPVFIEGGFVHGLHPDGTFEKVEFGCDTTLILIDTFWEPFPEYIEQLRRAHLQGAKTILCIHDIIPIRHDLFYHPSFVDSFLCRLRTMIGETDAFMCVSKTTMDDVRRFVEGEPALRSKRGGWFHLGADALRSTQALIRPGLADLDRSEPIFLSVGTVEPRKGYAVTLDAFETLWAQGKCAKLVIVGRPGWMSRGLQHRLESHSQLGRRLLWYRDASDADVSSLLTSAYCLIQASYAEGFGLPIVEAVEAGVPVIASDIPVFRELLGDDASFFANADAVSLATAIAAAIEERPRPAEKTFGSWKDSLDQAVGVARELLKDVDAVCRRDTRPERFDLVDALGERRTEAVVRDM